MLRFVVLEYVCMLHWESGLRLSIQYIIGQPQGDECLPYEALAKCS
jgi:hypothetical protein